MDKGTANGEGGGNDQRHIKEALVQGRAEVILHLVCAALRILQSPPAIRRSTHQ